MKAAYPTRNWGNTRTDVHARHQATSLACFGAPQLHGRPGSIPATFLRSLNRPRATTQPCSLAPPASHPRALPWREPFSECCMLPPDGRRVLHTCGMRGRGTCLEYLDPHDAPSCLETRPHFTSHVLHTTHTHRCKSKQPKTCLQKVRCGGCTCKTMICR